MITIANAQFWVHDQDEALDFYTRVLGWEVRADVTMEAWNFRWLCVGPSGQDDVGLVLMPIPGAPMLDAAGSAQLADLVAKGAGGTLFLQTDDCQASYDELSSARGRIQRSADRPALRHRHILPRSLRQQHPAHPGTGVRSRPPVSRGPRPHTAAVTALMMTA